MSMVFRCVDAGAPSCGARIKARDEEELTAKLTAHLKKHGVDVPDETVLDHLRAVTGQLSGRSDPTNP